MREIDVRRLLCPMPVIRTQNAIADAARGDKLRVSGANHASKQDISAWCRVNNHQVIEIIEHEDGIDIVIEVGGA